MDMEIVVLYGITALLREQVVINEGLCGLRGKLHHHACRGISVHVRILTRHVIVLDIHDVKEHITRLGLTGNATLVAIGDVLLSHIFSARLHQLHLNGILDLLHRHLTITTLGDMVSDLIQQALILTHVGVEHSLTNCRHDFLLIEAHDAAISFYYCLTFFR